MTTIKEQWEKGKSLRELSDEFYLSVSTIRRRLRKEGIDTDRGHRKDISWDEVRALYLGGLGIYELSERFKTAASTIFRHILDIRRGSRDAYSDARYLDKEGYVIITVDGNLEREHKVVMEQELDRKLTDEEVIHHIDFDRQNNALTNLFLFKNQGEHQQAHLSLRSVAREWVMQNRLYPSKPGRKFMSKMDAVGRVLFRFGKITFSEGRYA